MIFTIMKAAISGVLIAIISETAKRSPAFAALVASLPLVSVLAMVWMYNEGASSEKIAEHSFATFWYVLPSLPMFLILPVLLRADWPFYGAIASVCAMTFALYLAMFWGLKQFGITF